MTDTTTEAASFPSVDTMTRQIASIMWAATRAANDWAYEQDQRGNEGYVFEFPLDIAIKIALTIYGGLRMTAPPEQLTLDALLLEIDQRVDAAEDDGIRARWEFGGQLLTERVGKKLPDGRLDEVAELVSKSRTEIKYRMLFADRFPTDNLLVNAIDQYKSWYAIVNDALASTAHLSDEKDEWSTPDWLFDQLDAEFGFTLDVCAHEGNHKCDRYFGPWDDGLAQSWAGEIAFMNPPYSAVDEWMAKARRESEHAIVVCLVPSRTDVGWFWDDARHGEIRFQRGRLRFVDDDGNTGPAPFPSAVVVFGPNRPPGVVWSDIDE